MLTVQNPHFPLKIATMFMALLCILITLFVCILAFNLKSPGKRVEHHIQPLGPIGSETVLRSIGQLLGPPLVSGNRVKILNNGDEIFPCILSAISQAKSSITFETFIYWTGDVGRALAQALAQKAKEGVKVHVLLDWVGSNRLNDELLNLMQEAGVNVQRYRPIRWYNLARINNRTHRKILVIDGRIGFTGGVGIADQWQGHAQDKDHWRDVHFQVEGPVVAQLQSAFLDNWSATDPEVLHGDSYFPKLAEVGTGLGQVFKSSPEEGSGSVRLMYLYSIAHAQKSIRLASAYFVPDTHMRRVICEARKRGVQVEIIVPGKIIDTHITRRASRAVWGELLAAGVKIYEYGPTMFHCKYMIVDSEWVSVGSTNFDNRSFRLNDECNLNMIDPQWGLEMETLFEADRSQAQEITFDQWKHRPLLEKIIESLATLFRSQV